MFALQQSRGEFTRQLQVMDILKRLEQKGYKLVGIKVLVPSKELASKHYAGELPQHWAHERCMLAVAAVVVASKVATAHACYQSELVKQGDPVFGAAGPPADQPDPYRC